MRNWELGWKQARYDDDVFVANIYGSLHTNILVWTNQGRIYRETNEA